jgi:outer membrane lipoprotein-sorting protein
MKYKPQSLTSSLTLCAVAISAVAAAVSTFGPSVFAQNQDPPKNAAPIQTKSDLNAADVFSKVSEKLDSVESLSCEIFQTVMLSGQRFHAAGRYVHATGNQMRLEYRIVPVRALRASDAGSIALDGEPEETPEDSITGSLQQICDGSVLWSLWINGDQKELTRRNIREIVDAVGELPNFSAARSLQALGVGGLQTLVSQIQAGMEFGTVMEQQSGNSRLLVLSGRWTAQARKDYFGVADDSAAVLPEYVPDYVRIYFDADVLLPRRIEYLKKHPDPEQKQIRPVVVLDFRRIEINSGISDETFQFKHPAGDPIPEVDLTAQVIDSIKQIAAQDATATEAPDATTEQKDESPAKPE